MQKIKKVSLYITLLIFFILLSYSLQAFIKLQNYHNKIEPNSPITYAKFKFFLEDELRREYIKCTSSDILPENRTQLKTFYITIKPSNLAKLNSNLPKSGKIYQKGYLKVSDDPKIKAIKLKYRGDSNLHWNYHQKSLRIKLKKGNSYGMNSAFNLINPPHDFSIIDCVAYDISKELGLLSPQYEPVRVFINNQFKGVYIFLTQVDESFLRANKRMPGSIYYGDMTPKDMINPETPAQLFYESNYWVKKASRNQEEKSNREDIDYFIKSINNSDPQKFYNFAQTSLNIPKYNIFFALDTLFGAFHHDYAHNHKLYFDPYIGKFEPIQWDLRYWSAVPAKDISLYPLLHRFKLNPQLEAQRDKVAYTILKKYPAQEIIKRLEYYRQRILPDLKSDINRDTGIRPPLFPQGIAKSFTIKEFNQNIEKYKQIIRDREKFLYQLYNNTTLSYTIQKINKDNYKLILKVEGNSPIVISTLESATLVPNKTRLKPSVPSLSRYILYPSRAFSPSNPLHAPAFLYGKEQLLSKPSYYSFTIDNPSIDDLNITNYITGKTIIPHKGSMPNHYRLTPLIDNPKDKNITLQGDINVTHDLIFDSKTTVTIKPDTHFLLEAQKSIYFYGKVIAIGTKQHPITFDAKEPTKPWGVVAIQSQDASNSILRYVHIKNGSTATHNLINYTAPLSIHHLSNFTIERCEIGKNHIGDDALHIAYSKGTISNSIFRDARSDGLDIDISDIELKNSIFYNSGNDNLDIMTTKLKATNNIFIKSGDKGISVGEWSDANLTDNLFIDNHIAIEIKDNSILNVDRAYIQNAHYKAINLYHKNRRYTKGGTLNANNLYIEGKDTISTDKDSQANIKNRYNNIPTVPNEFYQYLKERNISYE